MRELPAGAMAVSAMHSCPQPDSPVREQTRTLRRSAIGFFERELEHETWRKDASPPVASARHLKNWMACPESSGSRSDSCLAPLCRSLALLPYQL
ncbi:MAG: hypothetical protein ACKN94_03945, partial [Pirellulaceae bacterium]